jgi:hypothetical protein
VAIPTKPPGLIFIFKNFLGLILFFLLASPLMHRRKKSGIGVAEGREKQQQPKQMVSASGNVHPAHYLPTVTF